MEYLSSSEAEVSLSSSFAVLVDGTEAGFLLVDGTKAAIACSVLCVVSSAKHFNSSRPLCYSALLSVLCIPRCRLDLVDDVFQVGQQVKNSAITSRY